MKQYLYLIVISFVVFCASCQKELSDTSQPNKSCKLVTAYYYMANGGFYDSSIFEYSGDKVMKAESDIKLITYAYSGSNITSRKYFDKIGNSVSFVDTAEYDAGNRMKKLTVWYYPGAFTPETVKFVYLFSYNGSAIEKVTTIDELNSNSSTPDTLYNLFRVNAAGNTENIVTVDAVGNIYDSIHYEYDNNPNNFTRIHPNYFLFDANFQFQGQYLHHLPYFFSKNNVTGFSYWGTGVFQVGYQKDQAKNLTAVQVDGAPYAEYKYECRQ